jgi:hypothetical protein
MEGLVFFLIFAGVGGFVIYRQLTRNVRQQVRQAWPSAAKVLGLRYASYFGNPGRIEGALPTGSVVVEKTTTGGSDSQTTVTRYRAKYLHPLGLGLVLKRETYFAGIAKALGAQDISVGDPPFDDAVLIKGNSPERVREFLTPSRRLRIRRAMSSFPGLVIDDNAVVWEAAGVHRTAAEIVSNISRLSQLAWFLSGKGEEDEPLENALSAQEEGHIEGALQTVRDAPAAKEGDALEARVVEGGVPHLGARQADAAGVFERAGKKAPQDSHPQSRQRADHVSRKRPGPPSAPPPARAAAAPAAAARSPASAAVPSTAVLRPKGPHGGLQEKGPAPAPQKARPAGTPLPAATGAPGTSRAPEARAAPRAAEHPPLPAAATVTRPVRAAPSGLPPVAAAPPEPPAGRDETHEQPLDCAAACEEIFHGSHTTLDVSRVFEERYEGKTVSWKGLLKNVDEYSFDFVFGNKPGTKACVEIHEVPSSIYGTNKIQALVQLEPGMRSSLQALVGKTVGFEGRLLRADGFMHHLYVADGKLGEAAAG